MHDALLAVNKVSAEITNERSRPWLIPTPINLEVWEQSHPSQMIVPVTNYSLLETFGTTSKLSVDQIAYADLQTNLDVNPLRRLGSGRAVRWRDRYYKGVGRTALAANFLDPDDVYHNSGHLFPSGAIREFAVTQFLSYCGKLSTILPCEGIALKPLDPRLKDIIPSMGIGSDRQSKACVLDQRFQSVTAKPSNFAKLSNLVWLWMHPFHVHGGSAIAHMIELTANCFAPKSPLADSDLTPTTVCSLMRNSVERGLKNCLTYFELGIHWGSLHNNFTADGRFMDLEVASWFGAPILGVARRSGSEQASIEIATHRTNIGVDAFYWMKHFRDFLCFLHARINLMVLHMNGIHAAEREFLSEFACSVNMLACDACFSEDFLVAYVTDSIAKSLSLTRESKIATEACVRTIYKDRFQNLRVDSLTEFKPLGLNKVSVEPGLEIDIFAPDFLCESILSQLKSNTAQYAAQILDFVVSTEAMTSIDQITDRLGSLLKSHASSIHKLTYSSES